MNKHIHPIALLAAVSGSVLLAFALFLTGLTFMRALFVGVNMATLACYAYDKHASQSGKKRIPETTLHLLAALGGTPGAYLGQELLRHKTRARKFRRIFFAIAVLQVVLLLALLRWGG